jgi:GNAT superfamily N-acetyltransferase
MGTWNSQPRREPAAPTCSMEETADDGPNWQTRREHKWCRAMVEQAGTLIGVNDIKLHCVRGATSELAPIIQKLCDRILPDRPTGYPEDRLGLLRTVELYLASVADRPIAFKLGYAVTKTVYFSWLGGVDESFRRRGVASRLASYQHRQLAETGMRAVETRTRSSNNAMLIVNLKTGFQIVGVEADPYGRFVVLQRKELDPIEPEALVASTRC